MGTRFIALILVIALLVQNRPVNSEPQYRFTMTFVFENRGTTPVDLHREDLATPLFVQNEWQSVRIVYTNPMFGEPYSDEDGNLWVDPETSTTLAPGARLNVTVVYEMETRDKVKPVIDTSKAGLASDIPSELIPEYTSPSTNFPADDAEIANEAIALTKGEPTVLGKLTNLIGWLNQNITYDNYEVPRFADETFMKRKGDCDDQSILLISMLRSLGIPAYLEIGVVFNRGIDNDEVIWDGHLSIDEVDVGWHGWVMVYVTPWGWMPVDLTLIKDRDPLEAIKNAPEYSGNIVKSYVVSKQDYVGAGRASRQRIIDSTIYVSSIERASYLKEPSWYSPTTLMYSVIVMGVVFSLFVLRRRLFSKASPGK